MHTVNSVDYVEDALLQLPWQAPDEPNIEQDVESDIDQEAAGEF